jgi:hypothetical protein
MILGRALTTSICWLGSYKSMIWTMVHELLTDYGTISRLWFDVFPSGPSNWDPGGFPQEYHDLVAYVREISPDTMLLSGSDGCMAGHEKGYSGCACSNGSQHRLALFGWSDCRRSPLPQRFIFATNLTVAHIQVFLHNMHADPLFHGQGIPNSLAGEMCSNDDTGLWYRPEEVDYSIQNPGNLSLSRRTCLSMRRRQPDNT